MNNETTNNAASQSAEVKRPDAFAHVHNTRTWSAGQPLSDATKRWRDIADELDIEPNYSVPSWPMVDHSNSPEVEAIYREFF